MVFIVFLSTSERSYSKYVFTRLLLLSLVYIVLESVLNTKPLLRGMSIPSFIKSSRINRMSARKAARSCKRKSGEPDKPARFSSLSLHRLLSYTADPTWLKPQKTR